MNRLADALAFCFGVAAVWVCFGLVTGLTRPADAEPPAALPRVTVTDELGCVWTQHPAADGGHVLIMDIQRSPADCPALYAEGEQ